MVEFFYALVASTAVLRPATNFNFADVAKLVFNNMGVLAAIKWRQWSFNVFGPHIGVCWINGDTEDVRCYVHKRYNSIYLASQSRNGKYCTYDTRTLKRNSPKLFH